MGTIMITKKRICILLFFLFISSSISTIGVSSNNTTSETLLITFELFRYLEENIEEDAEFWITCLIDTQQFISPRYGSSENGKPINWTIQKDISSNTSTVDIYIILLKEVEDTIFLCDLSENSSDDLNYIHLTYFLNAGLWDGDDHLKDTSGYGRLNGCDDGSIYIDENDAELFFSILQLDEDGDFIPEWVEINVLGTDPTIDDSLSDFDEDGIPTSWEWYFGYSPKTFDDHANLDPDNDSLSNIEEWLTWDYGSDPYRKDIFLEIDCMDESPSGESSIYPEESIEMLHYPFHRRNYVVHVNRSEIIPYDEKTDTTELLNYYDTYFLNGDSNNWRRGVFHYGIYVYETTPKGYAFSGDVKPHWGYHPGTNGYVISSSRMERNARWFTETLEYYYASATMHEMGHNFGFRLGDPFGCDAQLGKYPWQIMYYVYGNYVSIMNYRYTYKVFDYSNGTHGFLDHDDWGELDLTYFEYQ